MLQNRLHLMYPYLIFSNRGLVGLMELFDGFWVVTQILLASNEDNWETTAEMEDLRDPLFRHVSAVVLS